jgi:hypothetical protein
MWSYLVLDMPRQIGGWSFGLVAVATNTRLIVEITPTSPPAFTDVNASLLQPQALTAVNALAIRLTGIIVTFLTLGILHSARLPARKSGLDACG